MNNESQIRQNGKVLLSGDTTSIHIIFNNITGANFRGAEYEQYKKFIQSQGVDLSVSVELYENGVFAKTGNIL